MKKIILLVTVVLIAGTLVLAAGFGRNMTQGTPAGTMAQSQQQYSCQNFVDENGDGVCDNYGTGLGECQGNCDGTGDCTGIPLNPQDGTGFQHGRNR